MERKPPNIDFQKSRPEATEEKETPLYKALQNKEFFKEFTKNLPIDDKIGVQVLPNGAIIK